MFGGLLVLKSIFPPVSLNVAIHGTTAAAPQTRRLLLFLFFCIFLFILFCSILYRGDDGNLELVARVNVG